MSKYTEYIKEVMNEMHHDRFFEACNILNAQYITKMIQKYDTINTIDSIFIDDILDIMLDLHFKKGEWRCVEALQRLTGVCIDDIEYIHSMGRIWMFRVDFGTFSRDYWVIDEDTFQEFCEDAINMKYHVAIDDIKKYINMGKLYSDIANEYRPPGYDQSIKVRGIEFYIKPGQEVEKEKSLKEQLQQIHYKGFDNIDGSPESYHWLDTLLTFISKMEN